MPANPNFCPYCGYDLRAIYASWASACPLRMRCSECGHEFNVGELLGSKRGGVPVRGLTLPGYLVAPVLILGLAGIVLAVVYFFTRGVSN